MSDALHDAVAYPQQCMANRQVAATIKSAIVLLHGPASMLDTTITAAVASFLQQKRHDGIYELDSLTYVM
jgi:hypothetical protein